MKNHNRYRLLAAFLFTLLIVSTLVAQQTDSSLLTLERIYSSGEFRSPTFGPARWLEGGSAYTTVEPSAGGKGRDIVRYQTDTGARTVLVSAEQLIPEGQTMPLSLENYAWGKEGQLLLIFTNSRKVWRQNTRGDYWVLDRTSKKLSRLGGEAKPSTLMFAALSPDAMMAGYVRENNLYVEDLASHRITQLTKDGSQHLINGTFDWVYEEELGLRNGWRWSPDSKAIAYWQLDSEGVRDFYLINNTATLYPTITPIPYPKAGTTNSAARVGVVGVNGGDTRWFEVPGDPRNNYIAGMDWAGTADEILIHHLNRQQNVVELMLGDARTGKVRTILKEEDKAWVDVNVSDLSWLNDGKWFTWVSERDGWRHVYLVSRDGQQLRIVTPGKYDVVSLETIDEKGGWLYFIASPDNPTQRYLYRIPLDGSGKSERVSPASKPGWHGYDISPDAKWALHTYSSFGAPPRTDLISLPRHEVARIMVDNAALDAKVKELKSGPREFFRVDVGDGVVLDGWMIKPPQFDATKHYPVLFQVYGEPAAQTVVDRWGSANYLWHLMLAQQGYIVVSVDNRGTPAPRSREWRKIVYHQIGVLASQDQANAARAIGRWPFVDAQRIGIWGWSGGGSMTLNAMFRYPDVYRTGMSVAPVPDLHYYDTIYQERYMGVPQENEEAYKQGSPITFASQLKGNLLVVHGTGDDNVHYQGTEALINALVAANKPFQLMSYPNRTHSISEGPGTTRHLYELLTRYLHDNLPPGPR
jgi:dipeptidyl-peptidase-4